MNTPTLNSSSRDSNNWSWKTASFDPVHPKQIRIPSRPLAIRGMLVDSTGQSKVFCTSTNWPVFTIQIHLSSFLTEKIDLCVSTRQTNRLLHWDVCAHCIVEIYIDDISVHSDIFARLSAEVHQIHLKYIVVIKHWNVSALKGSIHGGRVSFAITKVTLCESF